MKVVIIGGGASGLVAAIYAAKQGNQVIILEKNKILGKKLLLTGNGKCNYWNEDQDITHYHSTDISILKEIQTEENRKEILKFLDSIGIIPKIKNGYFYPVSNQSSSIQTALIKETKLHNVEIILNTEVTAIGKNEKFLIKTNNQNYQSDIVIITTGSKAFPKTGSDGMGYQFAQKFGHIIINPLPALTSLIGNESYFKDWSGIRSDVEVSLYENDTFIKKEVGEIQLTNFGVSGICIFQLSGIIARGLSEKKKEQIQINFIPFLQTVKQFMEWMDQRNEKVKNRTISELLDGLLNYKLVNLILKLSKINREEIWNNLDISLKQKLANNILQFKLNIEATNSFDNAQVCSGGVSLLEIDPYKMESLKQKGLFFAGEILDVYGDCGGYNLGFAFISGMIAGKSTIGE